MDNKFFFQVTIGSLLIYSVCAQTYVSTYVSMYVSCLRPKFRSYKPQDDGLKENVVEGAKPADVLAEVQDQLSAGTSKVVVEELVRIIHYISSFLLLLCFVWVFIIPY